ncbi:MAG: hypothetical protein ACYCQJ_13740 [Nitrososphaerales archaeon]
MLCADLIYECLLEYPHFPTVHNFLPHPAFMRAWSRRHKWDELEKMMERIIKTEICHGRAVLPEMNVVAESGMAFMYNEAPTWSDLWKQFEQKLQTFNPPCKLSYGKVNGVICLFFGSGFERVPKLTAGSGVLCLDGVTKRNHLVFSFEEGLDSLDRF